ncbi:membrane protein of unknown function [Nitrospira moscoviensis]|uniref:Uncharacterized protein n=1 Tax=Nitrospira moscoviensis TaxID=42253 RepID=A0A0K2GAT5_NITMO|nr:membrane protein of unknown function [Nitrospira moscoviensis]
MHRKLLIQIFVVAALVNAPWEVAQSQSDLYVGRDGGSFPWWHCALMGLGDGVLVLAIFFMGRMACGRWNWFERPGLKGYATMLVSGLVISVAIEWLMVYVAFRWGYRESMPLIPWLGVGITPVVQMLILPPLVFWIVATWRRCTTTCVAL